MFTKHWFLWSLYCHGNGWATGVIVSVWTPPPHIQDFFTLDFTHNTHFYLLDNNSKPLKALPGTMTDGTQNVHPFSTQTYFLIQTPLLLPAVGRHCVNTTTMTTSITITTRVFLEMIDFAPK